MIFNPSLYGKLPYKQNDFVPVTLATRFHLLLPAQSPYQKLSDLIAGMKAKPGSLSYASTGIGAPGYLV